MDEFLDFLRVVGTAILMLAALVFVAFLPFIIWGDSRVPDIKQAAAKVWAANGFTVIGYQGYERGIFATPGGCVWYTVKRDNTIYQGCVSRWGQEYQIYNLSALNAITNK